MQISNFNEKLNKVSGNVYVIEEKITFTDGVYEDVLSHDNVNLATLSVYTGSKLTGTKITAYTLSTPSLAPWKKIIRVYADVPEAYISYETDGDVVEAEDINRVQDAITDTQEALNEEAERAKGAENANTQAITAEVNRAKGAENVNTQAITAEVNRAKGAENVNAQAITAEAERAKGAETANTQAITAEVNRAKAAEGSNEQAIATEAERAKGAENANTQAITAEVNRAKGAETTNAQAIAAETVRAKAAETSNTQAVTAEADRAKAAETANAQNITQEADRALSAEGVLRQTINSNKPVWDDKYTRSEVDNKISLLETAIDWKETVASYSELAVRYPKPEDGWTVNVKDTDYTYRWSGTAWIAISANAIPKATASVDGLMSSGDKTALDGAVGKAHTHGNMTVIDKITQSLLDAWNNAVSHISNKSNPHGVTKQQIGLANAENKTGATIRAEMTQAEVVAALGYTPSNSTSQYVHPNSGVSAGTYRSVTVNAAGHVTAGTNPTTLAGYGITDAMQKAPTWNQLMGV